MNWKPISQEVTRLLTEAPGLAPGILTVGTGCDYGRCTDKGANLAGVLRWQHEAGAMIGLLHQTGIPVLRSIADDYGAKKKESATHHSKSVLVHMTVQLLDAAKQLIEAQPIVMREVSVTEAIMERTPVRVFLSHSSNDVAVAEAIATLLAVALGLTSLQIRCTSAPRFALPGGVDTDIQLRREVLDCAVVIGLISASALSSTYVMFELGARWGRGQLLIPLLAPGATPSLLRGPLSGINALACTNATHLHRLVHNVGKAIDVQPQAAHEYQGYVDAVMALAAKTEQVDGVAQAALSIGSSFEPILSRGPGDNADHALVFRILNVADAVVEILRAVYLPDAAHRVPVLRDAKPSQVYRDGFEVKFGENWKQLSQRLAPGEEVFTYIPLERSVTAFEIPQATRGILRLELMVKGEPTSYDAVL